MRDNYEKYNRERLLYSPSNGKVYFLFARFFQIVHHNLQLEVIVTRAILIRC